MNVLLLANVGNHDLEVTEKERLPEDLRSPRLLGEAVKANFAQYRDVVRLPLLELTVNWLLDTQGYTAEQLYVHLFASDQAQELTNESEWLKDTAPLAEVIRQYMHWRWQISTKRIFIHRIEGSPADYANTLDFYQRTLPRIGARVEAEDAVFLEVSGGTPAMTSMLIVMGVETFGQNVVTLYLDRASRSPYEIGISKALFARKTRESLLSQLSLYAYKIAAMTVEENGRLLLPDENKRKLVAHLLGYIDRRLAFDYERARAELREAQALATGNLQAQIRYWLNELHEARIETQLAELIHSAGVKLFLGDYADFTQRILRFQEAIFRYMAENMGVEYAKADGKFVKQAWLERQSVLQTYCKHYRRGADGKPLAPADNDIDVRFDIPLNRFNLGAIVDFFVQQPEWQHWQSIVHQVFQLSPVADLRNRGVAGHGFAGISHQDISDACGSAPDALLSSLVEIYRQVFETEPGSSPYEALNRRIEELLVT